MTRLSKPVIRATGRFHRGREIIVELHPGVVTVRLKNGHRDSYSIGYEDLLERLMWQEAKRQARERVIAKRKERS